MNGPAIDYTNLGYDSLREAMLALASKSLPEWTDLSENDLGVLLIELVAYACDITLYYQMRIAANLLPASADEPDALVQLLRLIGYELRPPVAARADLRVTFAAVEPTPIDIPAGTQFFATLGSGEQLTYETARAVRIDNNDLTPADPATGLRAFSPLPVIEGRTVTDDPVAHSDGSPNQLYTLRSGPVLERSVTVTVDEPGIGARRWSEVESLATSTPADRHFVTQRDAQGNATILFGDGANGMVPPAGTAVAPVVIRAAYRIGGGPAGNVSAHTQFSCALASVRGAENPQAAGGGSAAEDVERARAFAPRLFRAQERAVTLEDYVDLAMQLPGVGKASASALNWNEIVLYVAPAGQVAEPSETLTRDLLAFFETRRLAGSVLVVLGPEPVDVYLRASVQAHPYYLEADVRAAVEGAIADLLAFDAVEFGAPVYLSRVYDAIQSLEQVASLNVTEFSRAPGGGVDPTGVLTLAPHELARAGYTPAIVADIRGAVSS